MVLALVAALVLTRRAFSATGLLMGVQTVEEEQAKVRVQVRVQADYLL